MNDAALTSDMSGEKSFSHLSWDHGRIHRCRCELALQRTNHSFSNLDSDAFLKFLRALSEVSTSSETGRQRLVVCINAVQGMVLGKDADLGFHSTCSKVGRYSHVLM